METLDVTACAATPVANKTAHVKKIRIARITTIILSSELPEFRCLFYFVLKRGETLRLLIFIRCRLSLMHQQLQKTARACPANGRRNANTTGIVAKLRTATDPKPVLQPGTNFACEPIFLQVLDF